MAIVDEPGKLTANCILLAGFISAFPKGAKYRAFGFDSATGKLFLESDTGNLFSLEIRQIAGTE